MSATFKTVKVYFGWNSDNDQFGVIKEMAKNCYEFNPNTRMPRWKNLELTNAKDADYYVIFNYPLVNDHFVPERTILFENETFGIRQTWTQWFSKESFRFLKTYDVITNHCVSPSWYMAKTYTELSKSPVKYDSFITVLGNKVIFPLHRHRINVAHTLNQIEGYKQYGRESISPTSYVGPIHCKYGPLSATKYTFNTENNREPNYFTEKILDPILCESLIFYDGCPNVENWINPEAFIRIDSMDANQSIEIIKKSIADNEYDKRLPAIKNEKNKFLNEYNVMNIIWKITEGLP